MKIRTIKGTDYDNWKPLYKAYQDFYQLPATDDKLQIVFDWLINSEHPQCGFVLENNESLIGLAHYQTHPNPITAQYRMYLNDLFVDEEHRETGCASLMIEELIRLYKEKGFESLRWLTGEDNNKAKSLYDKYAKAIPFITYEVS